MNKVNEAQFTFNETGFYFPLLLRPPLPIERLVNFLYTEIARLSIILDLAKRS